MRTCRNTCFACDKNNFANQGSMKPLLALSRAIDAVNERIGRLVYWCVLIMVLVSAANAVSRYALSIAYNAWLELQWYLFSAVFLLCSGYTLLHNEHIRIDVVAANLSRRKQIWIDIFGTAFFLLPIALYMMWSSWPIFMNAWHSGEISGRDRKSTRLNSSHSQISYAVFCLKKK